MINKLKKNKNKFRIASKAYVMKTLNEGIL